MKIKRYKGYTIKLFPNSDSWDYVIPGITKKGYPGRRNLYDTKEQALNMAKKEINNN